MQSTVPQPYNINGKKAPAHLNMPGGHWAQHDKYVSGDLQDNRPKNIGRKYPGTTMPHSLLFRSHFRAIPLHHNLGTTNDLCGRWLHNIVRCPSVEESRILITSLSPLLGVPRRSGGGTAPRRCLATQAADGSRGGQERGSENGPGKEELKTNQRLRLKRAFKEYGATVVVFHVAISLVSLGAFYLLVSR